MSAWPPEARAWLRMISPLLRRAAEHDHTRPHALVAIHEGRDRETLPVALAEAPEVSAMPLSRARALAALVADPRLAELLGAPTAEGEAWCLAIGPTSAGVVALSWTSGGELARFDA